MSNFISNAIDEKLENSEIEKQMPYIGKFILISNQELTTDEVIPLYYTRQSAEQAFGISKSTLNLLPLRNHTVQTVRGYIFLSFLALLLTIEIQKKLGGTVSVGKALLIAHNLYCKNYEDNSVLPSETQKSLADILIKLNIMVPKCMGI